MLITATNKPVMIRYKASGKLYAGNSGEADPSQSYGPFDEMRLEVGASFETGDANVLGVSELGDAPDMAGVEAP
jgi:hypothetical protein